MSELDEVAEVIREERTAACVLVLVMGGDGDNGFGIASVDGAIDAIRLGTVLHKVASDFIREGFGAIAVPVDSKGKGET